MHIYISSSNVCNSCHSFLISAQGMVSAHTVAGGTTSRHRRCLHFLLPRWTDPPFRHLLCRQRSEDSVSILQFCRHPVVSATDSGRHTIKHLLIFSKCTSLETFLFWLYLAAFTANRFLRLCHMNSNMWHNNCWPVCMFRDDMHALISYYMYDAVMTLVITDWFVWRGDINSKKLRSTHLFVLYDRHGLSSFSSFEPGLGPYVLGCHDVSKYTL